MEKLSFASDYMEGAHPKILENLLQSNMEKNVGYGHDVHCEAAREKIRSACGTPDGEIFFMTGGTQTNAMIIKHLLRPYQGVITAKTGHIVDHEAGAIEHGGHKVLCIPEHNGKVTAAEINKVLKTYYEDDFNAHIVMPGMVYLSQPTESGTLYSLAELEEISKLCHENNLYLYIDGARLAYALACPSNDVTLKDMARLCDVFYIGGTKCGAMIGEAVVMPKPGLIPHFFTLMKQHCALVAKGWILGIQFETLFTDDLYFKVGQTAVAYADTIRQKLQEKGLQLCYGSPTNQLFVLLTDEMKAKLDEKVVTNFWGKPDDDHTVVRIATSWATQKEDVDQLLEIIDSI